MREVLEGELGKGRRSVSFLRGRGRRRLGEGRRGAREGKGGGFRFNLRRVF